MNLTKLIRKDKCLHYTECFHPFIVRHTEINYCILCGWKIDHNNINKTINPQWWAYLVNEDGTIDTNKKHHKKLIGSEMAMESWKVLQDWMKCGKIPPVKPLPPEDWLAEEAIPFVKFCHEQARRGGEERLPKKVYLYEKERAVSQFIDKFGQKDGSIIYKGQRYIVTKSL